ncbi:MAG TPA: hypothetical protein DEB17_05705 [Chlorobaculum sp.]|uniref:Uncharacterized protein n=1 Tax=Chlorobaculum tepidum (strain ATCC 49652 / DSM 12025 / NBRC 103806 / TLS) TaxID=194439 RepID=Q8KF16_CHLTE|nr:hypothetical protein CT0516 [Chlorobaculum tepidum TLS]HBU23481.1 hypothetical protein [Chlorobaculum sp.]
MTIELTASNLLMPSILFGPISSYHQFSPITHGFS